MESRPAAPGLAPLAILFVALALSIGWGVRGNWGHEYGAMIPGALAAMAAVIVSGRGDWQRRIPFFAFFGAVGWSFGGSMSYMQVISYTHSGHFSSVLYGFACLFLMGFLWAFFGGVGTALPALLSRARLTELLVPLFVVFAAWLGQGTYLRIKFAGLHRQVVDGLLTKADMEQQLAWLDWFDTDWLAVVVAAAAVLVLAAVRRRVCWGTSLALYMCAGWWLGFTVLTVCLGLRMTPPRGENWSGVLGMAVGVAAFLLRRRELEVLWSGLVVGFFGGLAFSGSTLIKLIGVHPGFQERVFGTAPNVNWHSVLEQSFGFIAGIGVALALGYFSTRTRRVDDDPPVRPWADPVCVLFVIVAISYVNIVKNMEAVWFKDPRTLPEVMWGISTVAWFNLAYLALAVTVALPLVAYARGRELAILPATALGKGQLFFIVFLWWIVIGNLSRYAPFAEARLTTEGTIHINACLCTLFALLLPHTARVAGWQAAQPWREFLKLTAVSVAVGAVLVVAGEFALIRGLYGDSFAGHANKHIRFGPEATIHEKK
jgi:hypothetical protein